MSLYFAKLDSFHNIDINSRCFHNISLLHIIIETISNFRKNIERYGDTWLPATIDRTTRGSLKVQWTLDERYPEEGSPYWCLFVSLG